MLALLAGNCAAGEPSGEMGSAPAVAEGADGRVAFFEKRIRPVLVEHCYECHSAGADEVAGGLRLDDREAVLRGGDSGPAMVPGDPKGSLLLEAIRYDGLEMPPTGKLPERVIADFETWIKQGAADPRVAAVVRPDVPGSQGTPPESLRPQIDIEQGRRFWAFQSPRRQALPEVADASWPRGTIDYFILNRLEAAGLAPAEEADRRTWLRRVTFDLIGLPPTPAEVDAFVADTSPQARDRVVERLLASPRYGEHAARLWLDVARYAEDQAHIVGKDKSLFYPNAWLYRDWVIAALNADVPYDRFVRLQLAADLLTPDDPADDVALGFLGLGPKYYGRRSEAVMADEWEDRVDTVTRGLMGLTVACARCHDHKFDPIPTTDYYALAGVFASTEMFNRPLEPGRETKDDGQAKEPADAMHIVREGTPANLSVFIRGDVKNKGAEAPRRFLQVLCEGEPRAFAAGSGRRELAEAIASAENPLTARVIVNRVWASHFGRGLVPTPSNFGATGEQPTHPELLDDLAVRFVDAGWSLKWLHREIVLSATYGQSSRVGEAELAADPENRLLGRMPRRRLSVEQWRDAVLSAAGMLEPAVGGPSLDPQDPAARRRTVYSEISRLDLNPLLATFDYPDPNIHADRRVETTTPLQKLFAMNSPLMVAAAAELAERLRQEVPDSAASSADGPRIERAYWLLYGRAAKADEVRLGLEFIATGEDRDARWRQYAQVLLAANEVLFLD